MALDADDVFIKTLFVMSVDFPVIYIELSTCDRMALISLMVPSTAFSKTSITLAPLPLTDVSYRLKNIEEYDVA